MKLTALTLSAERYFPRYGKFIDEAEGIPERIKSVNDLEKYGTLVLSGGGDMGVKSGAYGSQTDNLPIAGVKDDRDELELTLLEKAKEINMPVLGICRGLQVMNVFLGGTLWPDIGQGGFDGQMHRDGDGGEPPIGDIPPCYRSFCFTWNFRQFRFNFRIFRWRI
jgi:gamma-glutamyl-gamma-aminobutyrate hydrolase PuuD